MLKDQDFLSKIRVVKTHKVETKEDKDVKLQSNIFDIAKKMHHKLVLNPLTPNPRITTETDQFKPKEFSNSNSNDYSEEEFNLEVVLNAFEKKPILDTFQQEQEAMLVELNKKKHKEAQKNEELKVFNHSIRFKPEYKKQTTVAVEQLTPSQLTNR